MKNEFSPDEKDFIKGLEYTGMPEDLGNWLDNNGPEPSEESLNRIKRATMSRVKVKKRKSFLQLMSVRVAAAVLVLSLVTTLSIGPQRVLAGIQNLLRYVPGFGLQQIEDEKFLAITKPVIVQSGNKRLEVLGLISDGKNTSLNIKAFNIWSDVKPENFEAKPYLVDENGTKYNDLGYSLSQGGNGPIEGYFSYAALQGDPGYVELVIPGHEELLARLPLGGVESLPQLSEVGTSASTKGMVVSAVPELRDENMVINLIFMSDKYRVTGVGSYPNKQTLPFLKDNIGKEYELVENNTSNLHFKVDGPKTTKVTLTIPTLMVEEKGEAKVKLPIPDGFYPVILNKLVNLGRYDLKITQVLKTAEKLRVYVSPGKNNFGALIRFKSLSTQSGPLSWQSKHDEHLGQMQYFEVSLSDLPKSDTVTFILNNCHVRVDGPWEFEINRVRINE